MTLSDYLQNDPAAGLAIGGLGLGFLFGVLLQRTSFCAMGGVSDWQTFGDTRRLRAWIFAGAVAIAGAAALEWLGVVDLARTMYRTPRLNWSGHILGGFMFGFGMVLAGGCASRNLVRAGSGDLRALIVLVVVGFSSYIALGGVIGPARTALEEATAVQLAAPSQGIADLLGLDDWRAFVALLCAALVAAWCLASRPFRSSPLHLLSGLGVGLLVSAGWTLTALAFDEMSARPLNPISLSFVKSAGDTLDWLARSTALGAPSFGAASVMGVLTGAFASALMRGQFRLATFHDTADTLRNLGGAALMGVGGVMALGCSIGQGVTGISTLAVGSVLALVCIVVGAVLALKAMERWSA